MRRTGQPPKSVLKEKKKWQPAASVDNQWQWRQAVKWRVVGAAGGVREHDGYNWIRQLASAVILIVFPSLLARQRYLDGQLISLNNLSTKTSTLFFFFPRMVLRLRHQHKNLYVHKILYNIGISKTIVYSSKVNEQKKQGAVLLSGMVIAHCSSGVTTRVLKLNALCTCICVGTSRNKSTDLCEIIFFIPSYNAPACFHWHRYEFYRNFDLTQKVAIFLKNPFVNFQWSSIRPNSLR